MKFKLKDLLKRTTASTLAIACFMTSACFLPIEKFVAWAENGGLAFYFKHNVSKENITSGPVYILEGVQMDIYDNLAEYSASTGMSYSYDTSNPIKLSVNNSETPSAGDAELVAALTDIKVISETKQAQIRPLVGFKNAIGNRTTEFILDPAILYSIKNNESVAVQDFDYSGIEYKSSNTDETQKYNYIKTAQKATFSIESGGALNLTAPDNTIEFEYKGEEMTNAERESQVSTEQGGGSFITTYETWGMQANQWEIKGTPTGFFDGYKLDSSTQLTSTGTSDQPYDINVRFVLTHDTKTKITADVNLGTFENIHTITPGSFKFSFTYTTSENRLTFVVVDRQSAVNDVLSMIEPNKTNYVTAAIPAKSTTGFEYLKNNDKPFIYNNQYTAGVEDTYVDLANITTNFYLKTRHVDYQYENGFYIEWEWRPKGLDTTLAEPTNRPEIPKRENYLDSDGAQDSAAYDAAYEQYKTDLVDFQEDYDAWLVQEAANQELYDVVSFTPLGVTENDDGTHSWINTTNLDAGFRTASVKTRNDDTEGDLVAKVFIYGDKTNYGTPSISGGLDESGYDGSGYTTAIISQNEVEIPIKITGKGIKPSYYITETIAATYDPDNKKYNNAGKTFEYQPDGSQTEFPAYKLDDSNEIQEVPIGTNGSFNMDVNDGIRGINAPPAEIPQGYNPPIPMAPHTVLGSIDFGTGIERSDRLVITNQTTASSTAAIHMKLHLSSDHTVVIDEHTFTETGDTWEINVPINENDFAGLDSYIYNFTIIAEGDGLFNMDMDFYSSDSDKSKTTLKPAISIGSSLPSSEAKLDKVYLHLVQDVVNPDNLTEEEKRIKDVLDTLYSDKTVTNASDNPLKGQIPTDILYNIDFTYENGYYYYEMVLPYVISDVMVTPVYDGASQTGGAYNIDVKDPTNLVQAVTGTGSASGDFPAYTEIPMEIIAPNQADAANNTTKWIQIKTLAADNKTSELYYLKLVRESAESTIALDDLYVDTTDLIGDKLDLPLTNASGTVVDFVPELTAVRYYISLPYYYYSQEIPVNITAISNGSWSKSPKITSDDGLSSKNGFFDNLKNALSNSTTETFVLDYVDTYGAGTNALGSKYPNKFTITTYSEANDESREYYLTIYIEAPDRNDDLISLEVMDPSKDDTVLPFKNGAFFPTKDDYIIEIPYELQKYRFSVMPESDNALAVRLVSPDGTILGTTKYANPGTPIQFLVDFAELGLKSTDLDFAFTIAVQSEDGVWSDQFNHPEGHSPYSILFQRSAPNSDSLLASLDVLNFEDATPIPEYVFEQVKKDYIFTVPYTTERVIIKPTAVEQDRTTITLNGVDFPDEDPGKDYYLTAGETNTFTIVVTAEDPSYTTTYNLYITRANPDNEARLLNLVVNGADSMTPALFIPSTYTYDVTIPVGTKTYTITPTAVSEYSVIIIDGIVIPSGTATIPYEAVDEKVTKKVHVSAQDGTSTQTYTLNITNHNLIEKSDDALLLDVNIQGVDLQPKFKSNIYDYEVYTKIDTTTLDITPKVSEGATVEVSVGSKKLDEINGIFSTSFFTDTDVIKIVVTSESGNTSKTYTFPVYKNTEDKEGIFKPVTDADVDWNGENPIVVDITKYTVVDASVFNTLKDKYPEKTLVFNGNDYMFRVLGSDITKNIPHTVQYDFGMSFTSPEEPLVQAILDDSDSEEDNELEPIYVYFNDHGALPAQMLLTVILGSSVGDEQLYWNYYNTEFDRIDYYGYVQSNSKGTITVPIAHFSTYLVSQHQIEASEDRTNTGFGSLDKGNHSSGQSDGSIGTEGPGDDLTSGLGGSNGGDISGSLSGNKPNPQTESDALPITTTERVNYEQTTVYKWYDERKKQKGDQKQEC